MNSNSDFEVALDILEAEAQFKRDKHAAYCREWRKNNRESVRASQQKHRRTAKFRKTKKRYVEENQERIKEKRAEYRKKYAEKIRAYRLRWDVDNKDKVKMHSKRATKRKSSIIKLKNKPEDILNMIKNAVSNTLPAHIRDDVIGAMTLAVLEGDLLVSDIYAKAKSYLASYNRQYDYFKNTSLDASVAGSDNLRRGDLIRSDAFRF